MKTNGINEPFIFMDTTISQLQAAMETGKVSSKELVDMYLQRIDAYDRQGPQLRAMLAINPLALEHASQQSMESPMEQSDYKARLERIGELKKQILEVMDGQYLNALLYPHQKRLVVKVGEVSQAGRNGIVASLIGFPAITFPGGFSTPTETAPIGVPIGLELLGRLYIETGLIRMAYVYEQKTDHRRIPPSTPTLH